VENKVAHKPPGFVTGCSGDLIGLAQGDFIPHILHTLPFRLIGFAHKRRVHAVQEHSKKVQGQEPRVLTKRRAS